MTTKIIAHRGASAYQPENTMEAFRLAISQQADGFELDVHLTRDGHVVVAHDLTLERVSDGTGRICDYDLATLKQLNFAKSFPDMPPCAIPTLADVYELVANTHLTINVELKTVENFYPDLPAKLLQLEAEYNMVGRVSYSSFNHYSLMAIKHLRSQAEIGLLYDLGLVNPWIYAQQLGAEAINPHYAIIKALPSTVTECHQRGTKVNVWTVDKPEDIALMLELGVDSIITNRPDVGREQTGIM